MRCENCGAELPDNAEFCYDCGNRVKSIKPAKQKKDEVILRLNRKELYIIIFALGIILFVTLIGISGSSDSSNDYSETIENEDQKLIVRDPLDENAVILKGTVEVGDDKDLVPGKYIIQGAKEEDEYYFWIHITKEDDKDFEAYLGGYDIERNYLLKEGYIMEVRYETAFTKMD